ncbi:MAG: hypothetical protein KatS3mg043_1770 [Rhodothermaceae bacterium]|nr:MAG: hypothetical protein KatS3mg043_1770 [Rhodothermaceae bacterium]
MILLRRRLRLLLPLFLCGLLFPATGRAQDASPPARTSGQDVHLTLDGFLQTRVSYGLRDPAKDSGERRLDRTGFGIRRARFRVLAGLGRAGAFMQLDGAGGTLSVLDFFASYRLSNRVRLRLGRFAGAQPRSLILTPSTRIDAVDRAAIAERWARQTIGGDGRDFGLELQYATPRAELLLLLHNGDGDWDRLRGNFRQGPSENDATRGLDTEGLALTVAGALRPGGPDGLELGGFAGLNGSRNPNTRFLDEERGRNYVTYGTHAYWGATPGSRAFRLKADVLGILYQARSRFDDRQHTFGASLLGAVRLHPAAEIFARAEVFDPDLNNDLDQDTYLTGGASLSLSALRGGPYHRERLTLAYTALLPASDLAPTEHLVILQAQIVF